MTNVRGVQEGHVAREKAEAVMRTRPDTIRRRLRGQVAGFAGAYGGWAMRVAWVRPSFRAVGHAVIRLGSKARGEPGGQSDIDLTVVAAPNWDKRADLQDTVRTRLGNECDVLLFTDAEFLRLAGEGEPVVRDILRDGVALVGTEPRVQRGAA